VHWPVDSAILVMQIEINTRARFGQAITNFAECLPTP
jgi:hypothetical protein